MTFYYPPKYKTSIALLLFLTELCVIHSGNVFYAQEEVFKGDLSHKTSQELKDSIWLSSPERAVVYEDALVQRYKEVGQKADLYLELGRKLYKDAAFDQSIYYFEKGIQNAKVAKNSELLAKLYSLIGNAELIRWNNEDALQAYYKALDIDHPKGALEQKVIVNLNIAIIKRRMKQLDQALEVCKEALTIIDDTQLKGSMNHVNLLTIASEVYLDLEDFNTVLKLVNKGLEISTSLDYKNGFVDLYTKKGAVYYFKGDFDQAVQYLHMAENVFKKNDLKRKTLLININYYLAGSFAAKKEYNKAISKLNEIIALADGKDKSNRARLLDSYKLLAACYKEQGNTQRSLYWLEAYSELSDKNQKNKDAIVNTIYEKETTLLGKQIEVLENAKANDRKYTLYAVISLVLISAFFLFFFLSHKKRQLKNKVESDDLTQKINNHQIQKQSVSKDIPVKEVIIDDQKTNDILLWLERLEQQEFFLSKDCSLRTMAKKAKTNVTYLSKTINKHKGINFNDYVNTLRIEYVVKRLNADKKFRSFSIKSIANEVGYKSDYSFAKHFKAKMGMNPSYHIKKLDILKTRSTSSQTKEHL